MKTICSRETIAKRLACCRTHCRRTRGLVTRILDDTVKSHFTLTNESEYTDRTFENLKPSRLPLVNKWQLFFSFRMPVVVGAEAHLRWQIIRRSNLWDKRLNHHNNSSYKNLPSCSRLTIVHCNGLNDYKIANNLQDKPFVVKISDPEPHFKRVTWNHHWCFTSLEADRRAFTSSSFSSSSTGP